jgi:hypothetical protein
MPAKIITYVESLRLPPRPRQARLNSITRRVIWLARLLPVFLGYFAFRSLFFPADRFGNFPGSALYLLTAMFAIGLWFLIPIQLKKDPRLDLLIDGEIAMGRITPVSRWQRGRKWHSSFTTQSAIWRGRNLHWLSLGRYMRTCVP